MSIKQVSAGAICCLIVLLCCQLAAAVESWPSFRGPGARGVADGADLPLSWSAETGENLKWRTPIPGLGHSSPVVWGDKVFLTTAVGTEGEPYLRVGLYGESPDNPEDFIHHYRVFCLDRLTGKVLWQRTAFSGKPQVQRHIKASHANSSAAVDAGHVVVSFGSQGFYCFDLEGKLLWQADLGFLDSGAFDAPEIQWGYGSSPVIDGDRVLVLCDVNNQSFLTALDLETGKALWRTDRDEVPTWGSPTVHRAKGRAQVIVNGWKHTGGYDLATGKELWRLRGGGDVPVPTPFVAHDLIFFSSSHGPVRPIMAVRTDATGDISLATGETANKYVAWSLPRRGSYLPTPIVYGDTLFVCSNRGTLTAYEATTGEQHFRERIAGQGGAYTASPVAADGRLYLSEEHGTIHVVEAGPVYKHLASNPMGEICMATPAITSKVLLVRTAKAMYGIARTDKPLPVTWAQVTEEGTAPAAAAAAPAAQPAPAEASTAAGTVSGPDRILELASTAAPAATASMRYRIKLEPSGSLLPRVPAIDATVTVAGVSDGKPAQILIDGTVLFPGQERPARITAATDGDRFYLLDHTTKTLHHDLEETVWGGYRNVFRFVLVNELYQELPFSDELAATTKELREETVIAGEPCATVFLEYDSEQVPTMLWFFAIKDHLPRGFLANFQLPDGKGELRATISELEVGPELKGNPYSLTAPEGYTVTEEVAQ